MIDEKNMRKLLKCIKLRYYSSKMTIKWNLKKKKKEREREVNGLSCDVTTYHLKIWSEMNIVQTSVHTNCDDLYIWIWPR